MSERLHKVLAAAGLGSRREMEDWIRAGRVVINGQVATVGQTVGPRDRVIVNGKPVRLHLDIQRVPRVLLYNKPEGEIVSRSDPEGRPTVFMNLPKMRTAKWLAIGRLDLNSGGLLLFTTSGELANRLMHPRYEVEREYAVRVMGLLTPEQSKQLRQGVEIDGTLAKFESIMDQGGEGANHWYHVVIKEGKNREVRRMFDSVGLMVSRLTRVRYGSLRLPPRLKRGGHLELEREEVEALLKQVGLSIGQEPLPRQAAAPRRPAGGASKARTPGRPGSAKPMPARPVPRKVR
jgi:23S rRNA pseudouridine2605 synthase